MDKQAVYEDLVDSVNKCDLCDGSTATSRDRTQRIGLEHAKTNHVNLWSYWQGNLSPEILVIGQDWGALPEPDMMQVFTDSKAYRENIIKDKNATDINLVRLFADVFSKDILKEQNLFFTNSVFCYKNGNLNENVCSSWFRNCNARFMSSLITLLEPKCVLTLGNKALHGLLSSGNVVCSDSMPVKIKTMSLAAILQIKKQLWWVAPEVQIKIRLFPLFHPGGYSSRNRPYQQQLQDWERVKPFVRL